MTHSLTALFTCNIVGSSNSLVTTKLQNYIIYQKTTAYNGLLPMKQYKHNLIFYKPESLPGNSITNT